MKTTSFQVHIAQETADDLTLLAKKEHKAVSALVNEILNQAIELREDFHFSKLAEERDQPDTQWVNFEDVWK